MIRAIDSKHDLQEARSVPRALVFLWVNWAVQAHQSEATLDGLLKSWERSFPQHPIPVYRADLSNQDGDVWEAIREWLEIEHRSVIALTFSGCGALLWMTAGTVAMHVNHLALFTIPKLLSVTRSIFEVSEPITTDY